MTVTLPYDTVVKLDAMAKSSLLISRGRVIQALVDEVIEVQKTVAEMQSAMPKAGQTSVDRELAFGVLLSLAVGANDIQRRLSKFDAKA